MNPIALFTSFSGRINRAKWWLGLVIVSVLGIVLSIFVNPGAMQAMSDPDTVVNNIDLLKPTILQLAVGLVMTFFIMALVFKRLNDRNWPSWVGMLIAFIYVAVQIAQYVVLQNVTSLADYQSASVPFSIIGGILFVFLLIDNGMLKGTVGPNQYGEDPLAHKNTDVA